MSENNAQQFEYDDDEQYHTPSECINRDIDLLFIIIFLEAFHRGENVLNFGDFFKGEYWDIDDVWAEVSETNEYYSIPDMVIEQAIFVFEDTRMGKIFRIGIDDLDSALSDLLIEIANIGSKNAKRNAPYYAETVEKVCQLKNIRENEYEERIKANPSEISNILNQKYSEKSVFFDRSGYFRELQQLIIHIPNHILLDLAYNKEKIEKMEAEIVRYLLEFSYDVHLENTPRYQEKRLYFSQQIENFCHYINRLNFVGNLVNIPFSILAENDFEAVKILKYLELNKVIKMNWSDENSWRVYFEEIPVTTRSLFPPTGKISRNEEAKLKSNLSFNEANATLLIGDASIKLRKGSDPYHLLRIMFENTDELPKEWFYSEISEKYDTGVSFDDKKFYNASYQVKQKIARETTLKDVLLTTAQSVRINPKYLD